MRSYYDNDGFLPDITDVDGMNYKLNKLCKEQLQTGVRICMTEPVTEEAFLSMILFIKMREPNSVFQTPPSSSQQKCENAVTPSELPVPRPVVAKDVPAKAAIPVVQKPTAAKKNTVLANLFKKKVPRKKLTTQAPLTPNLFLHLGGMNTDRFRALQQHVLENCHTAQEKEEYCRLKGCNDAEIEFFKEKPTVFLT